MVQQQFVLVMIQIQVTSNGAPTAVASGSSINYQWQSWTNGGVFTDIPGATGLTFDPSALSTTTI